MSYRILLLIDDSQESEEARRKFAKLTVLGVELEVVKAVGDTLPHACLGDTVFCGSNIDLLIGGIERDLQGEGRKAGKESYKPNP